VELTALIETRPGFSMLGSRAVRMCDMKGMTFSNKINYKRNTFVRK
jgi:hypothetical protein